MWAQIGNLHVVPAPVMIGKQLGQLFACSLKTDVQGQEAAAFIPAFFCQRRNPAHGVHSLGNEAESGEIFDSADLLLTFKLPHQPSNHLEIPF